MNVPAIVVAVVLVLFVAALVVALFNDPTGGIDWDDMDRHYEGPDR